MVNRREAEYFISNRTEISRLKSGTLLFRKASLKPNYLCHNISLHYLGRFSAIN